MNQPQQHTGEGPKHTPTPWHAKDGWRGMDFKRDMPPTCWVQIFGPDKDSEKDFVWQLECVSHDKEGCARIKANAALIVEAVNSHAAQRARIEALEAALIRLRDCDWVITPHDRMDAVRDIARAALTLSKSQP